MADDQPTETPPLDFHDVLNAKQSGDAEALTSVSLSLALQRARTASSPSWGLLGFGSDPSGSGSLQERQERFEQELRSGQFGFVHLDARPAGKPPRRLYLVAGLTRARLEKLVAKYGSGVSLYVGPGTDGRVVVFSRDGTEEVGGVPSVAEIARLYSAAVGAETAFEYPVQGFSEALILKARGRFAAKRQPARFHLNPFYHFKGLHVETELARALLSVLSALDPVRARQFIQRAFLGATTHAASYAAQNESPLAFDVRYSAPDERLTAQNGLVVALTYEGHANSGYDLADQGYEDSAHNSMSDARIVDAANDLTILIECKKGSWQTRAHLQRHMPFQFERGTPSESVYVEIGWQEVVERLGEVVREGGDSKEVYLAEQLAEYLSLFGLLPPMDGMSTEHEPPLYF